MRRLLAFSVALTVLVASAGFSPTAVGAQGVCPGDLNVPPIGASHIKTHAQNHVPACN